MTQDMVEEDEGVAECRNKTAPETCRYKISTFHNTINCETEFSGRVIVLSLSEQRWGDNNWCTTTYQEFNCRPVLSWVAAAGGRTTIDA